ncbi:hypothetical protein OKW35_005274 [Paraburkholderia sp. MM5477-R1]
MRTEQSREAWNKGKLVGQKPPLRPKDVWAGQELHPIKPSSQNGGSMAPPTRPTIARHVAQIYDRDPRFVS